MSPHTQRRSISRWQPNASGATPVAGAGRKRRRRSRLPRGPRSAAPCSARMGDGRATRPAAHRLV